MNGLAHLNVDELDAIVTHAACLLGALRKVSARDMVPFFREELVRLEDVSNELLMIKGAKAPEDFWDDTETV